jgi:membrane protein implicated in regulation of membrane protease activity
MNAGTAIAILLGPLLYQWLANHEGFTLQLVKLEAGIVFGLVAAIAFHIAGMIAIGREPSWNADEQVVIFAAVAFIALWEWRVARKPAVKHYDADDIEILPPMGRRDSQSISRNGDLSHLLCRCFSLA